MVLRMGKTLEARTMPGPGGRQSREAVRPASLLWRPGVLSRGPNAQGPSPDFEGSH